tara:strand:+ start:48 stop:197 length:150 start_codon:yes stop_codon:yes gene_type:complete
VVVELVLLVLRVRHKVLVDQVVDLQVVTELVDQVVQVIQLLFLQVTLLQ